MNNWIILTILYALVIGFYNCMKKKAMKGNSVYEVFAFFSLIAFIITIPISHNVFEIDWIILPMVLAKALLIAGSWLIAGYLINKIPISLYAVLMLSKILFTIILSVIWLNEKISLTTFIGMIIVIMGLVLVNNNSGEKEKKEISLEHFVLLLLSCLLSSVSSVLDKTTLLYITSSQLQFWFLMFLTIILILVLFIKEKKINYNVVKKNYWIPLMSLCLVIADRFLFMANEIPESQVSIITILKQISTIEIIVLGKFMFKEKMITKKILCSLLIVVGVIFTLV